MTRALLIAALLLALQPLAAGAARAECYADYKAKREAPLRLHYGTMRIPDEACSVEAARRIAARRLKAAGWNLLTVVSVFGPEGLAARAADAGDYNLRY